VAQKTGRTANVALRVNPDVDPKTHPYIATGLKKSKFGVPIAEAADEYRRGRDLGGINLIGVDAHIGSQLTDTDPFTDALGRLRDLYETLLREGFPVRYLDVGGGLGITYNSEQPPAPTEYAAALAKGLEGLDLTLILEPGRVIAGNAGVLVTRVLYTKTGEHKRFIVNDGAMNDLMRPALYGAFHTVAPVSQRDDRPMRTSDVVGPICESSDFFAQDRMLPQLSPGDLMVVHSAGAYGFTMSSNYNARPRAAEVLVDGDRFFVIRRRETLEDLVRGETVPPYLTEKERS
jgi:diaminopimelate decarboxylase